MKPAKQGLYGFARSAPAARATSIFFYSLSIFALSTSRCERASHGLTFVPSHIPSCGQNHAKICLRPANLMMQGSDGYDAEPKQSWVNLGQDRRQNFRRGKDRFDDERSRGFRDQRSPRRDSRESRPPSNQEDREPRNDRLRLFTRGDDGVKEVDESAVVELLEQRERARRNKDFEMADSIRDDLFSKLKVHVDDQRRIWWPDGTKPTNLGEEDLWGADEKYPAELNKAG
jgi:hypothetical protein